MVIVLVVQLEEWAQIRLVLQGRAGLI